MPKTLAITGSKVALSILIIIAGITGFGVNYSQPEKKQGEPHRHPYPKNYFRSPLDIPLYLAGTFGELRPNHFHSGIDIKTDEKEGLNVYAVAEGYVSRIRVQANGFGNALYVTHPNGLVSVYAHLQRYNNRITEFIRKEQYRRETFEIDTLLTPNLLPVRKSEVIAYSGNSGASQGPHLHFEVRDEKTEEPINFLLMYDLPDNIKPVIGGIYIYPLTGYSSVNGQHNKVRIHNEGSVIASGEVGIGLVTDDALDGADNRNGVYSIELKQDGKRIYYSQMERFYFHHSRAINTHIDYKEKVMTGRNIQKSFVTESNPLTIYKDVVTGGRMKLEPGKTYNMQYIVSDVSGNVATANFTITSITGANSVGLKELHSSSLPILRWNEENKIELENIKVRMPSGTLYEDTPFEHSIADAPTGSYSLLHTLLSKYVPAHDSFEMAILPSKVIEAGLKNKLVIVLDGKGSLGGSWDAGFVKAKSKMFGSFYIAADTIAPTIKAINIYNGKNMSKNSGIFMKIADALSGIKSYRATIDGKWVLMKYDLKYRLLTYHWDEHCPKGRHQFELTVTDYKNNTRKYKAAFVR